MDMAEIRLRLLRLASGGAIEYLLCTLVLVHDHTIIMVQLACIGFGFGFCCSSRLTTPAKNDIRQALDARPKAEMC